MFEHCNQKEHSLMFFDPQNEGRQRQGECQGLFLLFPFEIRMHHAPCERRRNINLKTFRFVRKLRVCCSTHTLFSLCWTFYPMQGRACFKFLVFHDTR